MARSDSAEFSPVAAIVVTWNSARFVETCLASLHALERPPAEIVVVDSGSGDATPDLVRHGFPEVHLIECAENLGFCRANNIAIRRTTSPFVLILNPDTRLEPLFLEELLPAFEDPAVGIAAGKLMRFDGKTLDSAGQLLGRSRQPIERGYGRPDTGAFERDEEVFGACGAAALYRRATLESIMDEGGAVFDETFFAFYEDLDLAWRARKLGWRAVYRHRAVGYHARGGTAEDDRVSRRWRALVARSPELRFHVVKNRYLTILRNDAPSAYLRDLPFILARDIVMLGIVLATCPRLLGRLWRERGVFRRALELRRIDAERPRPSFPGRDHALTS